MEHGAAPCEAQQGESCAEVGVRETNGGGDDDGVGKQHLDSVRG